MKTSYRFFAKLSVLKQVGFELSDDYSPVIVQGNDPRLDKIKEELGADWRDYCLASTTFTDKELASAAYLHVTAKHYLGYAQPDTQKEVDAFEYPFDDYPYYKGVFDIVNTDANYGVLRGQQIGSYQMLANPKWGRHQIGSLHYADDALFVPKAVYQQVFASLGILQQPVLDYRTKKELPDVVQLLPQGISKSPLNLSHHHLQSQETIALWGVTRYLLKGDVPYPVFENESNTDDFFYTQEYFGSGGSTSRDLIISQKLYQLLKDHKIRGLRFEPLLKFPLEHDGK